MRRLLTLLVTFVVLAVPSGEANAQAGPSPSGVRIVRDVPRPPDTLDDYAALVWEPVSGAEGYLVEASQPPRGSTTAPFAAIDKLAPEGPFRLIIVTSPWRGPYCYQVRAIVDDGYGPPSDSVCVEKRSEGAPFDVTGLLARRARSGAALELIWDYGWFPAPVVIERSVTASPNERAWVELVRDIPARAAEDGVDYVDAALTRPGWYCYRVQPQEASPDVIWSPEACVLIATTVPLPPDVGNSTSTQASAAATWLVRAAVVGLVACGPLVSAVALRRCRRGPANRRA